MWIYKIGNTVKWSMIDIQLLKTPNSLGVCDNYIVKYIVYI